QIGASAAALLCLSTAASADCSNPSPRVAVLRADVAFRGTARDVRPVGGRSGTRGPWQGSIVTFDVSRVWKGDVGSTIVLHQTRDGEDDVTFESGREYVVFARRNPAITSTLFGSAGPSFAARPCSGALFTSPSTPDPLDLGPGHTPVAQRSPTDPRTPITASSGDVGA